MGYTSKTHPTGPEPRPILTIKPTKLSIKSRMAKAKRAPAGVKPARRYTTPKTLEDGEYVYQSYLEVEPVLLNTMSDTLWWSWLFRCRGFDI